MTSLIFHHIRALIGRNRKAVERLLLGSRLGTSRKRAFFLLHLCRAETSPRRLLSLMEKKSAPQNMNTNAVAELCASPVSKIIDTMDFASTDREHDGISDIDIPTHGTGIGRYTLWVIDEHRYCNQDLGRWLSFEPLTARRVSLPKREFDRSLATVHPWWVD